MRARHAPKPNARKFNVLHPKYLDLAWHYRLHHYAGLKGAQFHALLYSSLDGGLKAMIEADLFGQMRTGAASGLASRHMANPDAHTLAVIGTGRQARAQAVAVCAVRPIKRVVVFSRSAERRQTFARGLEKELHIETSDAPSAQACVAHANIVVTITKAADPVCLARWLGEGVHVNAAGANAADRREVDDDMVLRPPSRRRTTSSRATSRG